MCAPSYEHSGIGPFSTSFFSVQAASPLGSSRASKTPYWNPIGHRVSLFTTLSGTKLLVGGSEGGTFRPLHIFSSHAKKYEMR